MLLKINEPDRPSENSDLTFVVFQRVVDLVGLFELDGVRAWNLNLLVVIVIGGEDGWFRGWCFTVP